MLATHWRWFLIGMFVVTQLCFSGSAAQESTVPLTVTAVNCLGDRAVPTLYAGSFNDSFKVLTPSVEAKGEGLNVLTVSLAQGHYFVRLIGHVKYCGATRDLTLLSGHPRHIIELMAKSMIMSEHSTSLAGSLPTVGLALSISNNADWSEPAEIDGDAYYFDGLGRGHYCLHANIGNYKVDLPLDLRSDFTIKNLTLRDLISGAYVGTQKQCNYGDVSSGSPGSNGTVTRGRGLRPLA
jgi:hypothetical protein